MRVLYISKPIVAPFKDGTKCLVRDVATRLERARAVVLTSRGAPALLPETARANAPQSVHVYSDAGAFAPALSENLRAAAWVLLRSHADVWHFVFAPNARTSQVGRWLCRLRGTPSLQTIASPPRSFANIDRLLFADIVVAQSAWTREHVLSAYAASRKKPPVLRVIPPPVSLALERSEQQRQSARRALGIPSSAPLFVYPGDLEVGSGARVFARLARELPRALPGAICVFAYRRKTARAEHVAASLARELDPLSTRLTADSDDVLSLVAAATAIVFPVDDLWGKVDLPIVLLEAMVLGVPVVALDRGPLCDLDGAELVPTLEPEAWLERLVALAREPARRDERARAQQRGCLARSSAAAVARAYEELYFELAPGKARVEIEGPVSAGAAVAESLATASNSDDR